VTSPAPWFRDPALLSQLPLRLRALAGYHRLATRIWRSDFEQRRWVRGGPFLVRLAGRVSARLGLRTAFPVTVDGVRLYVDFGDGRFPHVLGELRSGGPVDSLLGKLLAPGDTFIDVGANHGTYAAVAATHVGPSGTVVAIEPQPALAGLVRSSLELSEVEHRAVHQFACGERRESLTLHLRQGNSGVATLHPVTERFKYSAIDVEVDRIDDRIELNGAGGRCVVKLDVEGNELYALRGATELLDRHRPAVLFEVAPALLDRAGTPGDDLLDFFAERDYAMTTMESFPEPVPAAEIDVTRQRNLIAIPAEHVGHTQRRARSA
jgi:FkbM family methyltransferase